jgi:hypothetical protein
MKREDLFASAQKLTQVSEKSAEEFGSKRDHLVLLMNNKMENRADLHEMVGIGNSVSVL